MDETKGGGLNERTHDSDGSSTLTTGAEAQAPQGTPENWKSGFQESAKSANVNRGSSTSASASKVPGPTRRGFLIGAGGVAALFALGGLRYVGHNPLCRPPGGQDESHLVDACIRCQRCMEACPRHVLVPAHIEDGFLGMRTPTFDFNDDYCDFCAQENDGVPLCEAYCPTKALSLPAGATPQNTIIGLAVIDTRSCLAYRDTGCRFCYDACPYGAIHLSDDTPNPRPVVDNEACNGCGACESVCVSLKSGAVVGETSERAIVVRPLAG